MLAASVLQTTHFVFCPGRLFALGKLIFSSQRSRRLADVLQVKDMLNYCYLWRSAPPCLVLLNVFMGFPFDVS